MSNWTIREGRVEEVDRLVALRRAMFEAMGTDDPDTLDRIATASRRYFAEEIPSGVFRVWVACALDADEASIRRGAGSGKIGTCGGEPIASIGLVVHSVPPGPSNLVGRVGYIMNLVTLRPWQRMGAARALLTHVLDVLRAEGVPIACLHASESGRSLYEDLGFEVRDALPEMWLRLQDG
jgi:GNAT superfamily N-acetyltransferase